MLIRNSAGAAVFAALIMIATSAHSQSGSTSQPVLQTPRVSADSLLPYDPEPIWLPEAYAEYEQKPWLFLRKSSHEARTVDWFQKEGLPFGSMYNGTYSASWLPNRRSTVATDLTILLAVRGMPSDPVTSHYGGKLLDAGFFKKPETRARFVDLIDALKPELRASGVTRNGALSVLRNPENIDAAPSSHWAFFATQQMHHAGLLIGD